jgi:hypothetical protein
LECPSAWSAFGGARPKAQKFRIVIAVIRCPESVSPIEKGVIVSNDAYPRGKLGGPRWLSGEGTTRTISGISGGTRDELAIVF